MNLFCPECGYKMRPMDDRDAHRCENCGAERSHFDLLKADGPAPAHGVQCQGCEGIGVIQIEFTEWQPYGDTVVPEELIAFDDCVECKGRGYHLDDACCVVCGLSVKDGVLIEGWEVHEECSTESVPSLEGR